MTALKFRAYDGENFWYFTSDVGVFYKYFGGEQSSFDDPLEFSEVVDKGWPVDQWTGQGDIYCNDTIEATITSCTVGTIGEVVYDEDYSCFGNKNDAGITFLFKLHNIKVIGNTHEDNK